MAAATALQNLLLDKDAQLLVADLHGIPTVAKLLTSDNWILAARASGDPSCALSSTRRFCRLAVIQFMSLVNMLGV